MRRKGDRGNRGQFIDRQVDPKVKWSAEMANKWSVRRPIVSLSGSLT